MSFDLFTEIKNIMKTKNLYNVIGLMSGTSLDGLDLVYCTLTKNNKGWKFKIREAITVKYSATWKQKLSIAHVLPGSELLALDVAYGKFLGETTAKFIRTKKIRRPDFIASHGHTIFHQPARGFTYQLGNGLALHEAIHIPAIVDFRSMDVSRGGQGAPLVPVGDRFLFGMYDCCVNLGGIANLSMERKGNRVAFDFCFANMALNYLTAKMGNEFDKDGLEASRGKINESLLRKLTQVNQRWRKKRPSLGREFFEKDIQPLLDDDSISLHDRLRTCCESIAIEFDQALPAKKNMSIVVTGGGALNSFLMQCIKNKITRQSKLIVPGKAIIKFKEGLIFALLGVLRVRNEINSLKSVTGARQDSSGGVMIGF
jgi:anhydro-N-acetylmuramic acid kinase